MIKANFKVVRKKQTKGFKARIIDLTKFLGEQYRFHISESGIFSYTKHLDHPIFEFDAIQDILIIKLIATQTRVEAVLHLFHRVDLLGEQKSCHTRVQGSIISYEEHLNRPVGIFAPASSPIRAKIQETSYGIHAAFHIFAVEVNIKFKKKVVEETEHSDQLVFENG